MTINFCRYPGKPGAHRFQSFLHFAAALLAAIANISASNPASRLSSHGSQEKAHRPLGTQEEFVGPFASWANVKTNYGAVGDGAVDDTNAFQRALNDVGNQNFPEVLFVPSGSYKITSTLFLRARAAVSIIGQNPRQTSLEWFGPAGGTLLTIDGVKNSQFNRITFEGRHSANVLIDQSWYGSSSRSGFFDTNNEYTDDVFQDSQIGLRGGHHANNSAAEISVSRCKFFNNTVAAISVENYNALDWWIRNSTFADNFVGITNALGGAYGGGNFHVYDSSFASSSLTDLHIGPAQYFSFRGNRSIDSAHFVLSEPSGSSPAVYTLERNSISHATGIPIEINTPGPLFLLKNVVDAIKTPAISVKMPWGAIILPSGMPDTPQSQVVSVGNTFTERKPFQVQGTILPPNAIQNGLTSIRDRALPVKSLRIKASVNDFLNNYNRIIYEVPTKATTKVIQDVIDRAVKSSNGKRPVVHIPKGNYAIVQTLVIPPKSDVQIVGDGYQSCLRWQGPSNGSVIQIDGNSQATLRNFYIYGGAIGVQVRVKDRLGDQVYLSKVFAAHSSVHNIYVKGLDQTVVSLHDSIHEDAPAASVSVSGGLLRSAGKPAKGYVGFYGGQAGTNKESYEVVNGGSLLVEDSWYEGDSPNFVTLSDEASFTFSGGAVAINDRTHGGSGKSTPAFSLRDFNGRAAILNTSFVNSYISLSGTAPTQLLSMNNMGALNTSFPFLVNENSNARSLQWSNRQMGTGGTYSLANSAAKVSSPGAYIYDMLKQLLSEPDPELTSLPAGNSNVRLFRIMVEYSAIGIDIEKL